MNATQPHGLAEILAACSHPAGLCHPEDGNVRCVACAHRCLVAPGRRGICKVRFHDGAGLRMPWGYVAGLCPDPVEKKPFYHVLPGSSALTFGMLGCDFHCAYCQNWVTSQALRDGTAQAPIREVTPKHIVTAARHHHARLVVSSYNEPLITAEWAAAIFREAVPEGFLCAFVSNGNATAETLDFLKPWLRACKIDLKCFNDRNYRSLGGLLGNVCSGIRMVHERGIWLEIVTLLISGFNDSEAELREMARFIAGVSRDIPWHITAFHPDYRMTDVPQTTACQLVQAAEIGASEGLRYVYAGNAPGRVAMWENTRCHHCSANLIERRGYVFRNYRITNDGKCPDCATTIPGIWHAGGWDDVRLDMRHERGPQHVALSRFA